MRNPKGAAITEYALPLAVVTIITLSVVTALNGQLQSFVKTSLLADAPSTQEKHVLSPRKNGRGPEPGNNHHQIT